jgi:hypothetical protein
VNETSKRSGCLEGRGFGRKHPEYCPNYNRYRSHARHWPIPWRALGASRNSFLRGFFAWAPRGAHPDSDGVRSQDHVERCFVTTPTQWCRDQVFSSNARYNILLADVQARSRAFLTIAKPWQQVPTMQQTGRYSAQGLNGCLVASVPGH